MAEAHYDVIGVGKIEDLFAGRGLTESSHPGDNSGAMAAALERLARPFRGLLFVNLVDTDQLYGHRRDPRGYAAALEAFDAWLPGALALLGPRDALFITGDHGNDPTWRGTDHTREMAPLLVTGPGVSPVDLGVRATFADVGATLADLFAIPPGYGAGYGDELRGRLGISMSFMQRIVIRDQVEM